MSSPVALGGSYYPVFGTTRADTGAATNADTTPTVTILDNGVAMAYAPTVTNIATGLYKVAIDFSVLNGFTAGHRYTVYATATVNAISGSDCIDEFEVLANDLNIVMDSPISGVAGAVVAAKDAHIIDGTLTDIAIMRFIAALIANGGTFPPNGGNFTIKSQDGTKDRIKGTVDSTTGVRTITSLDGT